MLYVFRRVKFSIGSIFFQQILQEQAGEDSTDDQSFDEGSGNDDDDDEISVDQLSNISDGKKIVSFTVNEFIKALIHPKELNN